MYVIIAIGAIVLSFFLMHGPILDNLDVRIQFLMVISALAIAVVFSIIAICKNEGWKWLLYLNLVVSLICLITFLSMFFL
ncbi:hypothetical protein IKE_05703 [Bacillus cereus VD196]|uniref:Uncharacterized protein n=1 Tax=Bacillus cereus VD196 TaxID=1053243 RepID=A0A9W5PYS3_BACCE|nr:hypothetical protein [Bacillus cereus]EJR91042.1 hypothetical protein IKG_05841 [Bacillus cereus VD200]EOO62359.1 hypothetical protein IKE_05703 [Bacillus cereus VD196]